ncbi:MAG TPA: hypothetical protein VM912_03450, partial [Terriglobales bacterium]|nr:hypothetical protein [Terriglobales bacterium]
MTKALAQFIPLLLLAVVLAAQNQPELTINPGRAEASVTGFTAEIHNGVIGANWEIGKKRLRILTVQDKLADQPIALDPDVFLLQMQGGQTVTCSQFRIVGRVKISALNGSPKAARLAEQLPGQQITIELADRAHHIRASWRAILRDDSNYLRQEITLRAAGGEVAISEIRLISAPAENARVVGSVKGSPAVFGNDFLALEHPLSTCSMSANQLTCSISRELPLRAGQQTTYSSVIGVTRPGQLRRDFLAYLERERAHPYRTFLHYNTWYDLGFFGRFNEAGVVDRIYSFGEELTRKRGVKLDSFLLDDGWDDLSNLWHFTSGFPNGFAHVRSAAAQYGAAPGVWLSPWGGYGNPKQQRLESAHKLGFETSQGGLALSGPHYFAYFRQVCLDMIDRYGVNQFKFDGTGNADRVFQDSIFDSDFDAAITLISELRSRQPNLFVNLTTGTYPSPFWLRYADSIWRGGDDHSFAGVGTARQRWITYRDGATYQNVVKAGPLFPPSALMLHGLIYAQHAKDLESDHGHDFADEVHSYFGTGTELQEMYITPSLLSPADWDVLAATAKWSRNNAEVMRDTHWVGGDPLQLQVYGWAAWSPTKGLITLRNPSDHEQSFALDAGSAFELPSAAQQRFHVQSVWMANTPVKEIVAGQPHT